jgi:ABC-type transporter Mla MlaB component
LFHKRFLADVRLKKSSPAPLSVLTEGILMSKSTAKKEGKAGGAAGGEAATTIRLGADLGIDTVKALHGELAAHVNDAGTVALDASAVERVHGAAMQLFCLFCRDRRAAGHGVEFLNPSESLRNAAALLGAATLLNLAKATV